MADRNRIKSLSEIAGEPSAPRSNTSGLPTFDDMFFKRQASQAASMQYTEEENTGWSVEVPNDVQNIGTEVYTAPTSNPQRPRAYTIAYNPTTSTVIIVMRSGAWWQYNDVPTNVWIGLRNSWSTNDFLPKLEAACSSHHAANLDALSAGVTAQINSTAMSASNIQNGNTMLQEASSSPLQEVMEGRASLQSFSAEDLFKDYL